MEFDSSKGKVEIRSGNSSDLKDLIAVYKEVFKVHNIFSKPVEEIIAYLEKHLDHLLVAVVDSKVVGGVVYKFIGFSTDHGVWRLSHVAVGDGYQDMKIGSSLISGAEEKIKEFGKATNKVEIHLSVNEEAAMPFYKKLGFKVEGEVISHYRSGEMVYFLGKEI